MENVNMIMPDAASDAAEDEQFEYSRCYLAIKRGFDFIFSLLLSLVIAIPMGICAVLIMLKDPGSPFFFQTRVGYRGKRFKMVKLRSMKNGAHNLEEMLDAKQLSEYRKEFKLKDDPRLIGWKKQGDGKRCFGSILRCSSLDELPQILFNICLRGNMSLVGPRPILPEELSKYYTPQEQKRLLSVKPGLTGYWQAYARSNATYQTGKRQEMELYYIAHAGIWMDLKILFATIGAVIRKQGAV